VRAVPARPLDRHVAWAQRGNHCRSAEQPDQQEASKNDRPERHDGPPTLEHNFQSDGDGRRGPVRWWHEVPAACWDAEYTCSSASTITRNHAYGQTRAISHVEGLPKAIAAPRSDPNAFPQWVLPATGGARFLCDHPHRRSA
jgi:hypothetical protein